MQVTYQMFLEQVIEPTRRRAARSRTTRIVDSHFLELDGRPRRRVAPALRAARARVAGEPRPQRCATTSPRKAEGQAQASTATPSPTYGLDEESVRATFARLRLALQHHGGAMNADRDLVDADDVLSRVHGRRRHARRCRGPTTRGGTRPAGPIEWDVPSHARPHRRLRHLVRGESRAAVDAHRRETAEISTSAEAPVAHRCTALRAARLLAVAVRAAGPDDRGCHPYGHGRSLGLRGDRLRRGHRARRRPRGRSGPRVRPARATSCAAAFVRRIFPWAPTDAETVGPRCSGPTVEPPLGDREPERQWLWHCAPLDEWAGNIRRRTPR